MPHLISILQTTLFIIIFFSPSRLVRTTSLLFESNAVLFNQQRRKCSPGQCQEIHVKKSKIKKKKTWQHYLKRRNFCWKKIEEDAAKQCHLTCSPKLETLSFNANVSCYSMLISETIFHKISETNSSFHVE